MPSFTATVEAQYADELRSSAPTNDSVLYWSEIAARDALADAFLHARQAGPFALTGARVTISVTDLVATATLTIPADAPDTTPDKD